jgi:hypothetical protein
VVGVGGVSVGVGSGYDEAWRVGSMNDKVSAKEFFAVLGCDISDIVSYSGDADSIVLVTYDRDEEGNYIEVGPSFARHRKYSQHVVTLVKPGRPEGTTIANGAAPKTRRKMLPSD